MITGSEISEHGGHSSRQEYGRPRYLYLKIPRNPLLNTLEPKSNESYSHKELLLNLTLSDSRLGGDRAVLNCTRPNEGKGAAREKVPGLVV